jgi:hypothetical protein
MQKSVFGIAVLTVAAIGGMVSTSQAAQVKVSIPVVTGATALSAVEKGGVDGKCDCGCPPSAPVDFKPGYGFGTTGHYGPPGQGFTPTNSWRQTVAGGGTTTPKGGNLPPRAFK